ncbi:MAG: HAMP domain-containing histidine kinase [Verrucomicrobiaceae bacterium]|nr:HAMP domain-containing histidine kinase [Verrucomicrobiaceae bacterium]
MGTNRSWQIEYATANIAPSLASILSPQLLLTACRSGFRRRFSACQSACASLLLLAGIPAFSQNTVPALGKVKEILALAPQAADAGNQPAKIRGVVADVTSRGDEIMLHDGEACISVSVKEGQPPPPQGSQVEVEGIVFSETFFERKRIRIRGDKVVNLGSGRLPEAPLVSVREAAGFKHLDQWIAVEGTVLQVRASMALLTVQLASNGATCNVLVRDWPRDALPRDWVGGRVRLTGVNRAYLPGSNFLTVITPTPAQVTELKKGAADVFQAPAATVAELLQQKPERIERRLLRGTVLASTPGNVFYARSPEGPAFSFYMLHPIDEDKSGRYSTSIVMPECKPGDSIEVVGIPGSYEPGLHIDFAVVRVVGAGKLPEPIAVDFGEIFSGKHAHDLVETSGRLVSADDVLVAPGRWRTTMRLQNGEQSIIASMDASARGELKHLEINHALQVQGIVTGQPHFPEIRVLVRTPEDIQSLGEAKDVVTRRLWTSLGIAALLVITLAGWVLVLRRSRAAVREVNATLEARVTERTSELASAKDDLARALSQERELNELKTRFVSLVSHEFRTPLGVTMSAVEVLRHYGDRIDSSKRNELHEDIYSATLQMSGLMEQVLLLGKAEAGKLHWRPIALNLPELCQKLMDETLAAATNRCPIHFTADGDFDGATMDSALIRHIVGNLLSNAIKYSPTGTPVEFILSRENDEVAIIVKDSGIGVPEADQARLFEAFHRAANVGETPGTGLGLLLVKRCVELHRGSISMESKEGVGTQFTVRLPLRNT